MGERLPYNIQMKGGRSFVFAVASRSDGVALLKRLGADMAVDDTVTTSQAPRVSSRR